MADDTATEAHIDKLQAQLVTLQTAKGCLGNEISRIAEEIKEAKFAKLVDSIKKLIYTDCTPKEYLKLATSYTELNIIAQRQHPDRYFQVVLAPLLLSEKPVDFLVTCYKRFVHGMYVKNIFNINPFVDGYNATIIRNHLKALDQIEYHNRKPTISNSEYFLYQLTEEKKLEHTYDQKTRFAMENPT